MQNLGNIYICESSFVMSRTDAQNGLDIIWISNIVMSHFWVNAYAPVVISHDDFSVAMYGILSLFLQF